MASGLVAYAIVLTCERARKIDGDDERDRYMAYDERGARRSWFSSTRKAMRGRDLSDLIITSEGCAKEVVISHRDINHVRNDDDYACPPDALRSTSAVSEHDVSVSRVIIT